MPQLPQKADQKPNTPIYNLREDEKQFIETSKKSHAKNTKAAYTTDFKQYARYCQSHSLNPSEISPQNVARFLGYLQRTEDRKHSSLYRMTVSIGKAHKHPYFKEEQIKGFLKGRAKESKKKQAKPIMKAQLLEVCRELEKKDTAQAIRDRAMLVIGWYGAFRRSELASLRWEKPEGNGRANYVVLDEIESKGFQVVLEEAKNVGTSGEQIKSFPFKSDSAICPVRCLKALQGIRTNDYLFMTIKKGDKPTANPVSPTTILRTVQKYFGKEYTPHSLRAGFMTEGGQQGIHLRKLMNQSGHKTQAVAFEYIRKSDSWEDNGVMDF